MMKRYKLAETAQEWSISPVKMRPWKRVNYNNSEKHTHTKIQTCESTDSIKHMKNYQAEEAQPLWNGSNKTRCTA